MYRETWLYKSPLQDSKMEEYEERQIELESRLTKHSVELLNNMIQTLSLELPSRTSKFTLLRTIRDHIDTHTQESERKHILDTIEALCMSDLEASVVENDSVKTESEVEEEDKTALKIFSGLLNILTLYKF